jgi:hypothetical protein
MRHELLLNTCTAVLASSKSPHVRRESNVALKERERMRKSLMAIAAAALAASSFAIKAEAMPLGGLGSAADTLAAVEKSQYFYGGRNYCWYPDGWHGPGFYWCGFAYRTGYGWGGPIGWRGWRHGGIGPRYGGRGGVVVGPRGGAMVVGPRGGRAFVGGGGGGGPRMGGGGGGGPRMGGGGGGGPRMGSGGGGGGGPRMGGGGGGGGPRH